MRHSNIDITSDLVARKIFSDEAFTALFIERILGLKVQSCRLLDTSQIHLDEKLEKSGAETILDILAIVNDKVYVIIEIQMYHQLFFINRFILYQAKELVDKSEALYRDHQSFSQVYQHLPAVYGVAIVDKLSGTDDRPIKSFSMRDDETFEALKIPLYGTSELYHSHRIVIMELSKFTGLEDIDAGKREILEFLSNREFTQQPNEIIRQVEKVFDQSTWSREDKEMYDLDRRMKENAELRALYNREEGKKEGLKEGLKEGEEKGIKSTIKKLLSKGLTVEEVSDLLDVEISEVKPLKAE